MYILRIAAVACALQWLTGAAPAGTGLDAIVANSELIARVKVQRVARVDGAFEQKAALVVTEVIRGPHLKTVDAFAGDRSWGAVELSFVEGADQLVFLSAEENGWILLEAFHVDGRDVVRLGAGSTTWWVVEPRPYDRVREDIQRAAARTERPR